MERTALYELETSKLKISNSFKVGKYEQADFRTNFVLYFSDFLQFYTTKPFGVGAPIARHPRLSAQQVAPAQGRACK